VGVSALIITDEFGVIMISRAAIISGKYQCGVKKSDQTLLVF